MKKSSGFFFLCAMILVISGCGKKPAIMPLPNIDIQAVSSTDASVEPDTVISFESNVEDQKDMILVTSLQPNEKVSDVLMVEGQARAWWFSEDGQFTVRLADAGGETLGQFSALALEDVTGKEDGWVPFRASLIYEYPQSDSGFLVFERWDWEEIVGGWKNMLVFPVRFR